AERERCEFCVPWIKGCCHKRADLKHLKAARKPDGTTHTHAYTHARAQTHTRTHTHTHTFLRPSPKCIVSVKSEECARHKKVKLFHLLWQREVKSKKETTS